MDWKKVVGSVAPTLARAIGGPLGGAAISVLSSALGVDPSEDSLEKKVQSLSPEDLQKLKQADYDFQVEMRKLDVDEYRVENEDRASARAREVSLHDWVTPALAIGVFILFSFVVWQLQHGSVPVENRDAFNQVLGILYAAVTGVLGYYFGSSIGSRGKDLRK